MAEDAMDKFLKDREKKKANQSKAERDEVNDRLSRIRNIIEGSPNRGVSDQRPSSNRGTRGGGGTNNAQDYRNYRAQENRRQSVPDRRRANNDRNAFMNDFNRRLQQGVQNQRGGGRGGGRPANRRPIGSGGDPYYSNLPGVNAVWPNPNNYPEQGPRRPWISINNSGDPYFQNPPTAPAPTPDMSRAPDLSPMTTPPWASGSLGGYGPEYVAPPSRQWSPPPGQFHDYLIPGAMNAGQALQGGILSLMDRFGLMQPVQSGNPRLREPVGRASYPGGRPTRNR